MTEGVQLPGRTRLGLKGAGREQGVRGWKGEGVEGLEEGGQKGAGSEREGRQGGRDDIRKVTLNNLKQPNFLSCNLVLFSFIYT